MHNIHRNTAVGWHTVCIILNEAGSLLPLKICNDQNDDTEPQFKVGPEFFLSLPLLKIINMNGKDTFKYFISSFHFFHFYGTSIKIINIIVYIQALIGKLISIVNNSYSKL